MSGSGKKVSIGEEETRLTFNTTTPAAPGWHQNVQQFMNKKMTLEPFKINAEEDSNNAAGIIQQAKTFTQLVAESTADTEPPDVIRWQHLISDATKAKREIFPSTPADNKCHQQLKRLRLFACRV